MSDEALLKAAFNLPPEKAVEYFESKGYRITFDWHEMRGEAHTKAFTVAGVIKAEVLEDIKKALLEAEKEGLSYGQFKSLIIPTLQKRGWYGRKEVTRPDGSVKKVDLSLPWRLKTIFNTNMRTSMMAGRYKQMMDAVRTRPYWKYLAVEDSRTRESHKVLSGKIFRYDDPIWNTHFPPNGWGCRCRVLSISKDEFEKKGYHLSDGKTARQLAPIPPEWAYNPGKKDWKPDLDKYQSKVAEKLEKEIKALENIKPEDLKDNNIVKPDNKSLAEIKKSDRIESVEDTSSWNELVKYLREKYRVHTNRELEELDFESCKKVLKGFESMIKEFPEIVENLKYVNTKYYDDDILLGSSVEERRLSYSIKLFKDKSAVEKIKNSVALGEFPKNSSLESAGVHEAAHMLEGFFIKSNIDFYEKNKPSYAPSALRYAWCDCLEAEPIVLKACDNIRKTPYGKGKTDKQLRKSISVYATDSFSETLAEAFADVYANSNKANPLSIEIRKLAKEKYSKYRRMTSLERGKNTFSRKDNQYDLSY